ncbi:MATE family efflux transporter [Hymenobacter busanensis]|uniref:Multidrug-efflux transporter n=1 Tax=Hymenobacter busanensis TaxID=2607656 RepID=A0A7L4ZSF9_9BACT|nr:MATE family efflux transporter [Hymenobacter busanensis]KAA9327128.1 MATE family efflux transporter [Hymenobacter busanensis]QHJ05793.1 MATE family efflux transporter [Hymenobacter busanensis]
MALSSLRPHVRPTLLLAYPVVLSQLGHILVSVCDSVMVGQTGTVPLAAVSLGVSITTVVMMLGLGLSMGITPLVAAADGQGNTKHLGELLTNGVVLCAVAGVLLAGLGWLIAPLLRHLDQPAAVVQLALPWARVVFLSLIPLMVFQGFKQFAEGLGLTRQAMQLSVLANVLNAVLCYVLIFGNFGALRLGMMGAAWATLVARTLMAILMAAYVLRAPRLAVYRAAAGHWLRPVGAVQRRLLGLGLPIGVQMIFEVGAFGFSAIMVGWIGATAQAAHQIAINVASVTYMAASGIGAAATIRVGNLLGLGDRAGARHAGYTAYLLTFAFMSTMALLLIAGRAWVPQFYNHDPAVAAQAVTLLLIAALFQVSDGLQVVGLGALRGLHDVKIPSVVALLAYWAAALPLGYFLGFVLGWGATGVWIGLLVGLSLVAGLLLYRFGRLSTTSVAPARSVNEPAGILR